MRRVQRLSISPIARFAIAGSYMLAQDTLATLVGLVADPSGVSVPNAQVVVTGVETSVVTRAVSNDTGNYQLPFLVPGEYRLTLESAGFKTFAQTRVQLRASDRARVDVKLELGAAAERITVSGQAPLLKTESADRGQVIERLSQLSIKSNTPLNLIGYAAGVNDLGGNFYWRPFDQSVIDNFSSAAAARSPTSSNLMARRICRVQRRLGSATSGTSARSLPVNKIPQSRFKPVAVNVLKYSPKPQAGVGDQITGVSNFIGADAAELNFFSNEVARVHDTINDRWKMYERWMFSKREVTRPMGTNPWRMDADGATDAFRRSDGGTLAFTGALTPSTVLDLHASWTQRAADTLNVMPACSPNIRNPSVPQMDFTLVRDFRISEKHKFQFKAAAFNATHTPFLGGPDTDPNSTQFGIVTLSQNNVARKIELTFKYSF